MGIVPGGVDVVGERKAKVVFVQLDQGTLELFPVVHLLGKHVRLKLKAPTQGRHQE